MFVSNLTQLVHWIKYILPLMKRQDEKENENQIGIALTRNDRWSRINVPRLTKDFSSKRMMYQDRVRRERLTEASQRLLDSDLHNVIGRWRAKEGDKGRRQYTQSAMTHIRGEQYVFLPPGSGYASQQPRVKLTPAGAHSLISSTPVGIQQTAPTHVYIQYKPTVQTLAGLCMYVFVM